MNYFLVAPFSPGFVSVPCSYPGNYTYLYTEQDTVINANTYKKLYAGDFSECLYGFIREDTAARRVYFQDVVDSPEVVLYDFSLQIGDTFVISFISQWSNFFPSGAYRLDSITNVDIRAGTRRAFHLNCFTQASPHTLTWIESVGNLGDVIYPYSNNSDGGLLLGPCPGFPHDFTQFMSCFEHSEKVYYDSCAYQFVVSDWCFNVIDTCNYFNICGGINELNAGLLSIHPSPVTEKLMIRMPPNTNFESGSISVYNVLGEKVMSTPITLVDPNVEVIMGAENLIPGIYFIQLSTSEKIFRAKFIKVSGR